MNNLQKKILLFIVVYANLWISVPVDFLLVASIHLESFWYILLIAFLKGVILQSFLPIPLIGYWITLRVFYSTRKYFGKKPLLKIAIPALSGFVTDRLCFYAYMSYSQKQLILLQSWELAIIIISLLYIFIASELYVRSFVNKRNNP